MLEIENTILVIVDIQEKLTRVMHEKEKLVENAVKIIKGARILGLPILHTEQNPAGLGPTIPELAELLTDTKPISKLSFSCCGEEAFTAALEDIGREQVLLGGIESHVCVYQTAADLTDMGLEVHVLSDVVSSRSLENKILGLRQCEAFGAFTTGAEMALFELLGIAEGSAFKKIIELVK